MLFCTKTKIKNSRAVLEAYELQIVLNLKMF